jgi:hypothetical protein
MVLKMLSRWKINSIGYGHRIFAVIAVLIIAVPLVLYLCSWFLGRLGIETMAILFTIRVSVTAGVVLLVLFVLLLAIEFIQDRFLDTYYAKAQNQKLRLADGYYECQYCGSQKVRAFDKQCPVCGKSSIPKESK